MERTQLGQTGIESSRLIYGCMRLTDTEPERVSTLIRAALDAGYDHFDHADIYGHGACEELFGRFLAENPSLRDEIVITTKCGIRFAGEPHAESPKHYDFTAAHISASIDGSLARLGVEHVDILLLHRPDFLMRADEVAEAFESAQRQGKVRNFGVSNFSTSQVALLQSRLSEPLCVNQVEINLRKLDALTDGVLDQCQQFAISPQAWSPLAGIVHPGWGEPLDEATIARIRREIDRQAGKYAADDSLIALAWLLAHPSGVMPVIGSTSPERVVQATQALEIDYERDDWYRLLEARIGEPVP